MNRRSRTYDTRTRPAGAFGCLRAGLLGLLAIAGMMAPTDAEACVAEVYTQTDTVKISAHETAMAMTHAGSSMWFRLEFAGNPKDFGVLIPASPGSTLGLAEPEFFDTLRALTVPQIVTTTGGGGGGGCGCGSASSDALAGVTAEDGGVSVVAAANVGPYATVTLRSTDASALGQWLDANGFVVDDAAKAAAAAYVAEGLDFIAVKFRAGATTTKMPPLRLDTPTHDMRVLLRMALSGAGDTTDMVLYVLDTQRMRPQNFPEDVVDPTKVTVDSARQSNYLAVSRQVMAQADGRTWLTEFAGQLGATEYKAACRAIRVADGKPTVNPIDDDASSDARDAAADVLDAGTGPSDADAGVLPPTLDAGDGGDLPDVATAPEPEGGCSTADFMRRGSLGSTAMYVTRLRASLSRSALSEDLVLEPHPDRKDVSRSIIIGSSAQANVAGTSSRQTSGVLLLVGATALAISVVKRRAVRRVR